MSLANLLFNWVVINGRWVSYVPKVPIYVVEAICDYKCIVGAF